MRLIWERAVLEILDRYLAEEKYESPEARRVRHKPELERKDRILWKQSVR